MTDTLLSETQEEILDIWPQDGSQYEMVTSPATEVFIGGEAGGGKSYGFLLDFLEDIEKPKANGLFLRRHYPDLEGIIHDAIELYSGFGATFNESKHLFTFPAGARLKFGSMNNPGKDVYKYTGNQRTHYYWDELTQFPKMPYMLLMAWLRSPDNTIFKRVRASGNPDGEGYLFVKGRFIDTLEPFEIGHFKTDNDRDFRVKKGTPGAMTRQFIPCIRSENVALMGKDPEYESRLDMLPEEKKRAYKYGIWDFMDRPFQVIKTQWLQRALEGKNKPVKGYASLGADYAESGDLCTMCAGVGGQVRKFKEWPGMDTLKFGKLLAAEAGAMESLYGLEYLRIGVDAIGPGTGTYHYLKKTHFGPYTDPIRYKDPFLEETWKTTIVRMRFNNLRSQMWWKLREDLRFGRVDLSWLQSEEGFYDNLHLLQEELLAHTYIEKNGIVTIIPKDELRKVDKLGRSPDRADAFVIWNYVREKKRPGAPQKAETLEQRLDLQLQKQEREKERREKISSGPSPAEEGGGWQAG